MDVTSIYYDAFKYISDHLSCVTWFSFSAHSHQIFFDPQKSKSLPLTKIPPQNHAPLQPTSSRSAGRFSAETNGWTIKRTQSFGLWHGWISCAPFFIGIRLFENGNDGKRFLLSASTNDDGFFLTVVTDPRRLLTMFFSCSIRNNMICSRLL